MRALLLGLLLLGTAGCSSLTRVEVADVDQSPSVVVRPVCSSSEGDPSLVPGLSFRLIDRDGRCAAWGVSGAAPLVFRDVLPGLYRLELRGNGRALTEEIEVPARGRVDVAIDVAAVEVAARQLPAGLTLAAAK